MCLCERVRVYAGGQAGGEREGDRAKRVQSIPPCGRTVANRQSPAVLPVSLE